MALWADIFMSKTEYCEFSILYCGVLHCDTMLLNY